jgi:hypothetical protein
VERENIISKLEHIKIDYMSCYFFRCPKCDAVTDTHINHIYCQKCNEKPYKEVKIEKEEKSCEQKIIEEKKSLPFMCPQCHVMHNDGHRWYAGVESKYCNKCISSWNKIVEEKSAPKKIYKYNHRLECKQEYNPYCTCDGCCEERTDKKNNPPKSFKSFISIIKVRKWEGVNYSYISFVINGRIIKDFPAATWMEYGKTYTIEIKEKQ